MTKKKMIGINNGIKKKPAPELEKTKNKNPIKNKTPIAGFFCLFIQYPPYEMMTHSTSVKSNDKKESALRPYDHPLSHVHILSYKIKKSGFPRKIFSLLQLSKHRMNGYFSSASNN